MSTYTDITKARILLKKAEEALAGAEAEHKAHCDRRFGLLVYPKREDANNAKYALAAALEADGQCGYCEKPKGDGPGQCPGHAAYS